MELYLLVLTIVVVYLLDQSRRTRKAVEYLTSEMEKHGVHITAYRAAYNALFEEVRKVRREAKPKE